MNQNYLTRLFALFKSNRPADADFIPLSPSCEIRQQVIQTLLTIVYKRPAARGRRVMNGLVRYGQLWRTGAGHCTTMAFSRAVSIHDTVIPAGRYALFTIPDEREWTVILNKDDQQEGISRYDVARDAVRLRVMSQTTERFYESLTIDLDIATNVVIVFIAWERVQVSFPILIALPANDDYESRLAAVLTERPV